MITTETKKREVIEKIVNIADVQLLDSISQLIDNFRTKDNDLNYLAKPMRNKLDIEQLKKEQDYQGFNRDKTNRLIREIDLQEPLEDLLGMI